ncbi:chromo' (CHRromatin Organization MOdifier) domain protein [Teladorsagia circumcincta]|uniref:Chromo' (CHRromatin Organization MOdifier) domain protein n=1 Tax=Teladorsagia circumcincta TaxID=45464 RepID=A0A2G9UE15_TELCI|nr:chromo' (CHRromatin Organization MOdifier) domain protein [Teladorsagia circumcincta]
MAREGPRTSAAAAKRPLKSAASMVSPLWKSERVTYIVDKILDSRKVNGKREYLILWQDYGIEDATWESYEHCDCPDAIAAFNRERKAAKAKKLISVICDKMLSALSMNTKIFRDGSIITKSGSKQQSEKKADDENKSARNVGRIKVPLVKHGITRRYMIERGRKIEAIVGVNKDGDNLMYMVRYKGSEPQHHRSELVPSSVLRQVAMKAQRKCFSSVIC